MQAPAGEPSDARPRAGDDRPGGGADALVLAGRRRGEDPFAARHGALHRALVPVDGVPMLERVLDVLDRVPRLDRRAVSTDAPEVVAASPGVARRLEDGTLALVAAARSPARSVRAVLDARALRLPLLVTTADHALLRPEVVAHALDAALDPTAPEADVVAGLVPAALVRARFPGSRRTFLPLRGGAWSGANLYVLRTEAAARVVAFWTRTEAVRKRPWRIAGLLGPGALARFVLRRADLEEAFATLSRAAGARIRPVTLPFAEAAVDVDSEADLVLAERVLRERGSEES